MNRIFPVVAATLCCCGLVSAAESTTTKESRIPSFPEVSGSNLEGQKYTLPRDFEGEVNLAIVAFQRWHQDLVDTWIPDARKLQGESQKFRFYELPTIYRGNPLFRLWLDKGMAAGIPDIEARRATITLYLDKPEFRASLGIPDEETIHLFLVDRQGKVLWQSKGERTDEKLALLKKALEERVEPGKSR
jgi:hypothetical protein